MKYQIYLNKETSDFIEAVATKSQAKPVAVIKTLVEKFVSVMKPSEATILKEIEEAQNGSTSK